MDVEIRPAVPADLAGLSSQFGQQYYFQDRIRRTDLGVLLVALQDGAVVGNVYIRFTAIEEWEIRDHLRRVPVLSHLQVVPDRRSQGIGSQLMEAAEQLVRRRGHTRLALGVNLDNERAYRLYCHRGYEEWQHGIISTINTFVEVYDDHGRRTRTMEKCHVMTKDLAQVPTSAPGDRLAVGAVPR